MKATSDESLAVMFALEGAREGSYSIHSLFLRLPRILREQWSERYLAEGVLKNLLSEGLIETTKEGRTPRYRLTTLGVAGLR